MSRTAKLGSTLGVVPGLTDGFQQREVEDESAWLALMIEHVQIEVVDQLHITQPTEALGVFLRGPEGGDDGCRSAIVKAAALSAAAIIAAVSTMDLSPALVSVSLIVVVPSVVTWLSAGR